MKEYQTKQIRNVVILGHQGSGKTSLTEALCYITGCIDKKGEVERKTTVSDYLLEEQAKLTSFSSSLVSIEYKNFKINLLDAPGNEEFISDISQDLSVVKGAILLIDSLKGVEVGTEKYFYELKKRNIPTIIFLNKMDKENVNFDKVLADIKTKLGNSVVPFSLPLGHEEDFNGYIDITANKAHIFNSGVDKIEDVHPDKQAKINALRDQLIESVAETSEELMEKFFGGEELSKEEMSIGLKTGVTNGDLLPVLVGSARKNIGVSTLLDMILEYLPAPGELKYLTSNDKEVHTIDSDPFSGYVFKTTVDPFLGVINYLKIFSGTLAVGQDISVNDGIKKLGSLFTLRGKTQIPLDIAHAGDIVATVKLDLNTSDSLSDPKNIVAFKLAEIPTPIIYIAITPKNSKDEDKISASLNKLSIEDPSLSVVRNEETAQLLIGGQGLNHLGYILEKLKNMFKVEVTTEDQKIVYRETIKKIGYGHGAYKKQSGGAGQFGVCDVRFEPNPGKGFEFSSEVVGGAVSKGFQSAVEKGLIDTFKRGPLAGFPVIDVKCIIYDGKEHPVDSHEESFKAAAKLAFKDAIDPKNEKATKVTILEPIVKLVVLVKETYIGDIYGDMSKRRGKVLGTDSQGFYQAVTAEAPEAEIVKYAIDLKAMTQGSGSFTREFVRYEEAPGNAIEKIVAENKKVEEE
ncbi:MAG: elongation factor G [Acholeplasmatales bacterium]|jgi:elongation factor G|nr:elongation factor G [Acholeplasmatales bacterium]